MKSKTNKLSRIYQWILSIVISRYLSKNNESQRIKSLFLNYFDGFYARQNTANTFAMGVCKLEYENKKLTVHLRRPGLLIGKGGQTIDALAEYLECKIVIVEVNLYN